ncbi:hypothetical protein FEM33_08500 [Dyadobacter flavalbus]|uniref:Uncharacterized protein n=1 Tax=Dyadobacter flavalbus TaxID=2579942 RepID=A0A5M8QYX4_9BACT|nr:hypothetical protein [Dyadobacter flavalbus]KAA6440611.1 hypothetical protein FEM33_08500 [Dyadobacter flavalbus]
MHTETHANEAADWKLIAYGREVSALLSSSNAESWNRELWTMFSGFMLAQSETGHTPNLSNTYFSFKELLEFFEKVERIRRGE